MPAYLRDIHKLTHNLTSSRFILSYRVDTTLQSNLLVVRLPPSSQMEIPAFPASANISGGGADASRP